LIELRVVVPKNPLKILLVGAVLAQFFIGCAVCGFFFGLGVAISVHYDPETVRAAAPAYMILADAMILADERDPDNLISGAKLYTAYYAAFSDDPERGKKLTRRAFNYASKALCIEYEDTCGMEGMKPKEIAEILSSLDSEDDIVYLHAYATAWLAWMQARSDQMTVLARLPKVQMVIEHILKVDEEFDRGSTHLYAGIIKTLRPPAFGGKLEEGKAHFLRALELSNGENLSAKVELARRYARMLYDRELHDKLLNEVIEAGAAAKGLTLSNTIAKEAAHKLLESGEEYF
jgi:hypothetical protein